MPRKPTTTVRVDLDSHIELRRLARLYQKEWGRYISIADVVRVGITLSNKELLKRKEEVSDE